MRNIIGWADLKKAENQHRTPPDPGRTRNRKEFTFYRKRKNEK
jgi:hypothetical protein